MAPERFLAGLLTISDEALAVALVWHVLALTVVIAIAFGWRPKVRGATQALVLPILSVSIISLALGELLSGVIFALLAIGLTMAARPAPRLRAAPGPEWSMIVGLIMIAFAWVYPHFLVTESALTYLYAAPFGLVPSPTMALVIGFALLAGGFGARGWSMLLGTAGVLFGLTGALAFGVFSDLVLAGGALSLVLVVALPARHVEAVIAPI